MAVGLKPSGTVRVCRSRDSGWEVRIMNKKVVVAAAVGFLVLFGLSLPAEAQGFHFGVGINFGYGSAYFTYGRPWYGPAYYPHRYAYYPPYY
jgi:hypothetical protein